ncbi:hypothetical protein HYPDE_41778 [Hyphomicrobium denitrificans 1NES1]|uniref:Choloylglycine hydrolase/NAAA C-terminal domain-containing protein n=2 Tax=Hyphomicrobium denitrificans TaxID=53399 RepID=N0BCT6_9HYPH|nr:hypothetical protein HYPDE_41778 [Hyphomicrobium denitrificans 1NES1]
MFATATAAGLLLTAITITAAPDIAAACTRVLWNTNKLAVVSGRTMDWPESTEPTLTVFPRGSARDGGRVGSDEVVKENPAKWTAKYGSIVTTVYGIAPSTD